MHPCQTGVFAFGLHRNAAAAFDPVTLGSADDSQSHCATVMDGIKEVVHQRRFVLSRRDLVLA